MSFINPYNQSGMIGATGSDRPSWKIPTYNPATGTYGSGSYGTPSGYYDVGTPGSLGSVARDVTGFNIAGQQAANAARIPGATGLEEQSSKMIADQLMGKVPEDVLAMLGTSAGERSNVIGMVGAPASEAAYRRALGLTSIGQQEAGQRNLSAALARNPAAKPFDPESMIITPLQQAELDLRRRAQDLAEANASRGGGGGGGGYAPRVVNEGQGAYIPTVGDLFGGFGRGTMYSNPNSMWSGPVSVGQAISDQGGSPSGYYGGVMPTSSGYMYVGDPTADYYGGGWMDEFFGNTGEYGD